MSLLLGRLAPVLRMLMEGGNNVVGTTESSPTTEGAGSLNPNPPAC